MLTKPGRLAKPLALPRHRLFGENQPRPMPSARRRSLLRPLLAGLLVAALAAPTLGFLPAANPSRYDGTDPIPPHWRLPHRPAPALGPDPFAVAEPAALRAGLDRARAVASSYGLTVSILHEGAGWTGATGVTRDGTTRLRPDAPFVIGSVTKTFVTAALLQLAADGDLSLDDQVTRWLPGLQVAAGVTIRELLTHTSGIADLYPPLHQQLVDEPQHVYTHAEVLARIGGAWFAPGTDWGYSNTNFVIAGLVLERVTGEPAETALARRVTGPLHLAQTWLLAGRRADPLILDPSWATAFWTAGAMQSTAADLARWGAALYGGNVVTPAQRRAMTTFNGDDYGIGTRRFVFGAETAVGHSGLLATTSTLLVYFPREHTSVAIIANRAQVDLASVLVARVAGQRSLLELALGPTAKLSAPIASPSLAPRP
jgi:D-alanyl-D-alanine carboxypeptidase